MTLVIKSNVIFKRKRHAKLAETVLQKLVLAELDMLTISKVLMTLTMMVLMTVLK